MKAVSTHGETKWKDEVLKSRQLLEWLLCCV